MRPNSSTVLGGAVIGAVVIGTMVGGIMPISLKVPSKMAPGMMDGTGLEKSMVLTSNVVMSYYRCQRCPKRSQEEN